MVDPLKESNVCPLLVSLVCGTVRTGRGLFGPFVLVHILLGGHIYVTRATPYSVNTSGQSVINYPATRCCRSLVFQLRVRILLSGDSSGVRGGSRYFSLVRTWDLEIRTGVEVDVG